MQSRAKSSKSGSGFMARLQAFFNLATRWISRSSLNTPLHQPRHKRVGCCESDGEDAAGGSSSKLCSCYACWCGRCDALDNHDRSYLPRESLSTDSSSQPDNSTDQPSKFRFWNAIGAARAALDAFSTAHDDLATRCTDQSLALQCV